MGPPPRSLPAHRLVAPAETLAAEVPALARRHRLLAYAGPSAKPGRLGGVPGELIAGLHAEAGFAVTLVKADGARMRWLKAPRDDEPVLPPDAATVLRGGLDPGAGPSSWSPPSRIGSSASPRSPARRWARAWSPRIWRGC